KVSQAIPGVLEGAKIGDVPRIRPREQVTNPRSHKLIRALVSAHPRQRVIAFGEITESVKHLDLLVLRQCDRDRLFEFEAPDRVRTIRDESAITLLALPNTSYRPRSLDGLPALVGYFLYKLDLPGRPAAWRLLADGHPCRITPVLVQRRAHQRPDSRLTVCGEIISR